MPLQHYSEDAPRSLSEVLVFEVDMRWSREGGTLAACPDTVPMGAVLARDESGNYLPYMTELTPAVEASEGVDAVPATYADQVVAVLISKDLAASEGTQACTVVRRGAAVANLSWLASVTDAHKQTALAQLSALGIVPKE